MDRAVQAEERACFREDGVALLKGLLAPDMLAGLEAAYAYTLDHPGPGARSFYDDDKGRFFQDGSNLANWGYYRDLLRGHPLTDACRALWDADEVWFMNEQAFLKHGRARRTPWHQDASYTPYDGDQLAIMWINFDPVPKEASLEFVRGSHRGVLYNGSAFDPADDTAPADLRSSLPRLPDIEHERERWDILSFAVEPGDVVVFHNRTLHGGGATDRADARRRTLSLRFFGADVRRVGRDEPSADRHRGQLDEGLMTGWGSLIKSLEPGQPLSAHPEFPRL